MTGNRNAIFLASAALIAAIPAPASAQTRAFNVPAQAADAGIAALGRQADIQIVAARRYTKGIRTNEVRGSMSVREALSKLLKGTGLVVRSTGPRTFMVVPSQAGSQFSSANSANEERQASSDASTEIIVTGSHIRGAPSTSPVTTIGREEAKRRGQTDLGQIIRDLPQNYTGGQNPTVAGTGQGVSFNTTGSSAINLRGLGPDATLTLFNGHRVAFDAVSQGVDISAIPLEAVEKIDIVADGASALYGSDAVGGVANVQLRRSFQGLYTSARLGAATDGGAVTQQYDVVAGQEWASGGFMAAGNFQKSNGIAAGQRSYTSNQYRTATLIQPQKQFSLVAAGEQEISANLTFQADGHYLKRSSTQCTPTTATADCTFQGNNVDVDVESFSISPSLRLTLPGQWTVRLAGTYSKSDSALVTRAVSAGVESAVVRPHYVNDLKTVELGAEGSLFTLPGGEARLAIGGGYRKTGLDVDMRRYRNGVETPINVFGQSREVLFGYGELYLPLVGAGNRMPALEKLQLLAAVRYEDHRNIDQVVTPKVGLLFSPANGIEFAGSWGKSFKAPTLYQTGQTSNAQLVAASIFTPAPGGTLPVLYVFGGNTDLKPERATTWSISGRFEPQFFNGLDLQLNYFHIRYRDRVAEPISSVTGAFQSINSSFVQFSPTAQEVLGVIDGLNGAFTNLTTGAFDPGAVSAIVFNQLQNVSVQTVRGLDMSAKYRRGTSDTGQLTLGGAATWLDSKRQVTQALPTQPLAGVIFNSPHWRVRADASWQKDNVTASIVGTHIGGTLDNRLTPSVRVAPYTAVDAIVRIETTVKSGLFSNIAWTVGIQNLLNEKPSFIRTTNPIGLRYDATNYPTSGRVVSFTLAKHW